MVFLAQDELGAAEKLPVARAPAPTSSRGSSRRDHFGSSSGAAVAAARQAAGGMKHERQHANVANDDTLARGAATLKLAALHFDVSRAAMQDGSWRSQQRHGLRSPRMKTIQASTSEAVTSLQGKSDADIVQMLLENDLSTATFIEYLQQHQGSPTHLIPWLQTLAALASKVGLLLESTRFLTCDLQLARILMHIQVSARALVGGKRAAAVLVNAPSDALMRVGDRGEVLPDATESLSRGTSFAAHCARSAKPLVIGMPGTPQRAALQVGLPSAPLHPAPLLLPLRRPSPKPIVLYQRTLPPRTQFNVDSGSGCRPETCLCVPCLDHLGSVLAVIQVIDRHAGGSFGRDDLILLQRFAMQCGVSLRNVGGRTFTSAAPTGIALSPRNPGTKTAGTPGRTLRDAKATVEADGTPQRPTMPRRPRTTDACVQCELLTDRPAAAATLD
jgi:hypothetical protein